MADYTKTTWVSDDGTGTTGTALSATNLNAMESGIQDAAQHNKTGTLASRAAAASGNKGWCYHCTDTGGFAISDGSAWQQTSVPQVRVTNTVAQSINSGTLTALTFDTEAYDTGTPSSNMHDTGSNTSRLVCRVAGLYYIHATFAMANAGIHNAYPSIRLNGTTLIPGSCNEIVPDQNGVDSHTLAVNYRLAVNDYVEVMMYHDLGSAINTFINTTNRDARPAFEAVMLST